MNALEKILRIIQALMQRSEAADIAEKSWNTVAKFLLVKIVPRLSLLVAAWLVWILAHGHWHG